MNDCEPTFKILYIEDDPASKKLISSLFEDHANIEIQTAWSAEEGVEMVENFQPDLILVDINLPWKDGLWALKEIKSQEKSAPTIVALSANAIPEHIDNSLKKGFDQYFTKPVDLEELLSFVLSLFPRLTST